MFFFFEQISRFDMENYIRIRNTGNNNRKISYLPNYETRLRFTFDTYYRPSKFNLATNFIARDANH